MKIALVTWQHMTGQQRAYTCAGLVFCFLVGFFGSLDQNAPSHATARPVKFEAATPLLPSDTAREAFVLSAGWSNHHAREY